MKDTQLIQSNSYAALAREITSLREEAGLSTGEATYGFATSDMSSDATAILNSPTTLAQLAIDTGCAHHHWMLSNTRRNVRAGDDEVTIVINPLAL